MTDSLATIRSRYEATPRTLDTDLQRMARGDRGCLGDGLAGLGGVAMVVFGVLASFGLVGWGFMSAGALLLVTGFLMSAAATARSGPLRRKALTDGPLVLAQEPAVPAALGGRREHHSHRQHRVTRPGLRRIARDHPREHQRPVGQGLAPQRARARGRGGAARRQSGRDGAPTAQPRRRGRGLSRGGRGRSAAVVRGR